MFGVLVKGGRAPTFKPMGMHRLALIETVPPRRGCGQPVSSSLALWLLRLSESGFDVPQYLLLPSSWRAAPLRRSIDSFKPSSALRLVWKMEMEQRACPSSLAFHRGEDLSKAWWRRCAYCLFSALLPCCTSSLVQG